MKIYIIITFIISILSFTYCKNKTTKHKNEYVPIPTKDYIVGIDISHYQGNINWSDVELYDKKPISFIYIKATEGSSLKDHCYKKNYLGAKSKSILVGSYHYFRTSSSVNSQFKNFKEVLNNYPQDLIPMVDIEEYDKWKKKSYIDSLDKFLKLIETYYGKKPILYASNYFYNQYLSKNYLDYNLWIARYNKKKPKLNNNKEWLIWQCTDYAKVKGIQNCVDINLIKTEKQLTSLKLKPNENK